MPLPALFGSHSARRAYRLAKATVRDGILVAWLPAPSPKHSFSTFSQILRNLALCYETGVQALNAAAKIPHGMAYNTRTLSARGLPRRSSLTTSNETR
jgi:hypothetical protein